jgi:hypothetical protein
MNTRARITSAATLSVLSTLAVSNAAHAQLTLQRHVIAGGGGTSSSGVFTLTGTIGQHDAGPTLASGNITLTGGFWPAVTGGGPACGTSDFNCDGDFGTDADIESFFACLGGSCPPQPCPASSDFNADGDFGTDADIEAFFRVLGGGAC